MPNYNQIIIVGHAGKDAELAYPASGTPYAKFTVAVNGGTKEAPKTTWFDVVCFKQVAESAAKYVHKGDAVMVVGRMESNKGKDGKTYWQVVAQNTMTLRQREAVEAPKAGLVSTAKPLYPMTPPPRPAPAAQPSLDIEDDDLPF